VDELQILRGELDVDHAAGDRLEIVRPRVARIDSATPSPSVASPVTGAQLRQRVVAASRHRAHRAVFPDANAGRWRPPSAGEDRAPSFKSPRSRPV
jgi:hypothetical protein